MSLDFDTLRRANLMRLPEFKNPKGEPAHAAPDGSDWALSAWCNAVCGELGEAANLIKKIERGDFTLEEKREELGKEFADIVTYLDILAMRAGVNLGEATVAKFNEVSRRVGSSVVMSSFGFCVYRAPLPEDQR
jgi:NTP pyrophosphatase (non-canonical NTP hydrolase)